MVEGQTTVWYAGKLKMGTMPQKKFNREDLVKKVPEWRKDGSRGRYWVECVSVFYPCTVLCRV